jgi:hypothetical protein
MENFIRSLFFALSLVVFCNSNACIVTITNDSNNPILLVTEDNKQATLISAHSSKDFGSNHQHARFYVMKKSQEQLFNSHYFVGQYACSSDKQILSFSLSDIERNALNNNFFKVSQYNKEK